MKSEKKEDHFLSPDVPLKNPTNDAFGYASFAKDLSQSLNKMVPSEGIVMAIYGEWGSGKSTLLNFVSNYLDREDNDKLMVFRFNPWWFSDREDLTRLFFDQLSNALGKNKYKALKKKIADMADALSDQQYGWVASLFIKIFGFGSDKDVVTLKEEIGEILKESDKKIIIMIDDIDRLNADEIRDLFRTIKAVGNLPNIIYLLAFDKEVVVKALETEQNLSGSDYLEKIVQVPFELPVPDKILLRTYLFKELEKILNNSATEEFDEYHWGNVYYDGIDPFIQTPRDIVRYTNAVSVTFPIVKNEVNTVDFLAIEALRVFNQRAYNFIKRNQHLFTGIRSASRGTIDLRNKEKEEHETWLETVSNDIRPTTIKLLKRLFPRFSSCFGGAAHGNDFIPVWRKDKRICSADVFPVYFRLTIPEGNISQVELNKVLELTGDEIGLKDTLLRYSNDIRPDGRTMLYGLFQRLGDYLEDIPDENIESFVKSVLNIGDQISKEADKGSDQYGIYKTERTIWMIIRDLLKRLNQESRKRILHESLEESDSIGIISEMVHYLIYQHNEEEEKRYIVPVDERLIESNDIDTFKKLVLEKIRTISDSLKILQSPNPISLLYNWKEWGKEDEVKEWAKKVIETDDGLLNFLNAFKSEQRWRNMGMMGGGGDLVMRKTLRVNPKDIDNFIDTDSIIERVKLLANNKSIDQKFVPVLERFIQEYEAIKNGEDPSHLR